MWQVCGSARIRNSVLTSRRFSRDYCDDIARAVARITGSGQFSRVVSHLSCAPTSRRLARSVADGVPESPPEVTRIPLPTNGIDAHRTPPHCQRQEDERLYRDACPTRSRPGDRGVDRRGVPRCPNRLRGVPWNYTPRPWPPLALCSQTMRAPAAHALRDRRVNMTVMPAKRRVKFPKYSQLGASLGRRCDADARRCAPDLHIDQPVVTGLGRPRRTVRTTSVQELRPRGGPYRGEAI
jgi:hypothetical protein